MKKIILSFLPLFIVMVCNGQPKNRDKPAQQTQMPKLVVGIVVDQMRYDFLYRYYDRLSDNGFKRLMQGGVNCTNMQYNYLPTNTAPGHASIYTGCPPAIHGIAGNDWYDKRLAKMVYCTQDDSVEGVGMSGQAGKMSPRNMKVTTIGDQIKLATGMRSKNIGIALKDRGAILPGGHVADAAYWFESDQGNFGTSTYYMKDLPTWVTAFNNMKEADKYINATWNTLYPIASYVNSDADNVGYEKPLSGASEPVFPHQYSKGKKNNYDMLRTSPFGNTITADFAIASLQGEGLGKDDITDYLTISFSSTDYIGHSFGPNSIESEDTYYRLDQDIARVLNALDKEVGKDNYLLFLTADHGICDVPGHSLKYKMPGGVLPKEVLYAQLNDNLNKAFGVGKYILEYEDNQFFVNKELLIANKVNYDDFYRTLEASLMANDGIAKVIDLSNISNSLYPSFFLEKIRNGIHPQRSGDVLIILEPGWIVGYTTGASHGSMYEYDSHVPGIFYGWGLKHSEVPERVQITDIAATIATLLHLQPPTGSIGNPIPEVIRAR